MTKKSTTRISVVIPNWNGKDSLGACLDSLLKQTIKARIIVVENGSSDGSLAFLQKQYPSVEVVIHEKNRGFAGGVNGGIRKSLTYEDDFVALFNNDAVADPRWLESLVDNLIGHPTFGIATCKLIDQNNQHLDSTGEVYTTWGLPYPRGRGEPAGDQYDRQTTVFAASGGASLYRVSMLRDIGLFDEDFFAYYEDVDISFRAQLAGWKVCFTPRAVAYHQIGATSSKIHGFTTYQTTKNLPLVLWKNAPLGIFLRILPRFLFAYYSFILSAGLRSQIAPALRGHGRMLLLLPKKTSQRWSIQRHKKVQSSYIWNMLSPELPPNATRLRALFHPLKMLRGVH